MEQLVKNLFSFVILFKLLIQTWSQQLVEAPAKIVEFPESAHVVAGTVLDLKCIATGVPAPLITFVKDGRRIWDGAIEYKPFSNYSVSVMRLNATVTANYTCHAINQLTSSLSTDYRSFIIYAERPQEQTKAPIEEKKVKERGYCAPYNGLACRSHLHGRGMVWYKWVHDNRKRDNEEITMDIQKELLSTMAEPCKSAAEALLCHFAFPSCVVHSGVAVRLPLCQEDCLAVRNSHCLQPWAEVESNKKRGVFVNSRGHFRLPSCEKLPRYNNQAGSCTKSQIFYPYPFFRRNVDLLN